MEGSRFYPNPVCTRILEPPPSPNLACASRRLPRTFPDAPTTHRDYFVSYQCNTISSTASWNVSGSRLLDIVSKIGRLFARSAQLTGNLPKRLPCYGGCQATEG